MGLISLFGKAAISVAKNINKIDDVSDGVNLISDKVNQIKDLAGKANDLLEQHEINKRNKIHEQISEMKEKISRIDAVWDGKAYENTVKIIAEKKLAFTYAIPPQYDHMMHIGNNLFAVCLNNKWGIIDIHSQIIVPFEYDDMYACDFDGSDDFIFPVQKSEKWGYINLKNEIVIDFIYADAWDFKQGLAPVSIPSKDEEAFIYGYIDKTGEFIIPAKYDTARPFNNSNCASVGMYDETKGEIKYGVINKAGGIVVNCRYDKIYYEKEYIIGEQILSQSDFYDYMGVPLTSTEEMRKRKDEIKAEKDKLKQAAICKSNENVKNKIIPYFNSELICGYFIRTDEGSFCKIEPIFEEAYNPNKFGYARVKYNGLYGVINLND